MAPTNMTEWTIVWLDANVNGNEQSQNAQKNLARLCNYFRAFEDTDYCDEYIRTYPEATMILIVSGRLSREIIAKVEQLKQISSIFIYCMDASRHIEWAKEHPKINGIPVRWDELSEGIRSHQKQTTIKPLSSSKSLPKAKAHRLDGYENMSVMSLEKATTQLSEVVKDLKQMVWTVIQNCRDPSDNLTTDESAAIMLLTLIWFDGETTFANVLNETIASNDDSDIERWFPYIKLLFRGLSKLPNVSKSVYRSVSQDLTTAYPKEKNFHEWKFSLCTSSIKNLEKYEDFSKSPSRTLFTMQCRTGKDISKHSFDSSRETILLLPGREWKVVSHLPAGDGFYIIQMEEKGELLKI